MSCFCSTCNRFVEDDAGKCATCGDELRKTSTAEYFVSGPYQRQSPAASIEPGTELLNRFTVLRRVGHGAGTAVYLARDSVRSAEVALKVVEVGASTTDTAVCQLQHEMALHERVADHRHVIRVFDMHFVPMDGTGLLLLAMEYAEGGTLRQWMLERREDLQCRRTEGLRYFKQACLGVGALHEAGAVHLDLKPENLLFVDGVLKVSDFGLSLAAHSIQTATGTPCDMLPAYPGTAPYMSPEHFTAPHLDALDERTDIYSLGVILHEIQHARCRPPFGGSYERLRELHLRVPAPQLDDVNDSIAQTVARCLEKMPTNRYPDVWTLLDDLDGQGTVASPNCVSADETDLDRLWKQARWHMAAGDYHEALRSCGKLLELCPEFDDARRMSTELNAKFEQAGQIHRTIESSMDQRSLSELVALLREAVVLYPGHSAGQTTLASLAVRAQTYRQCMEAGRRATQEGFWDAAISQFRHAYQLDPVGTGAAHALEFLTNVRNEVNELRRRTDEAIQNGHRDSALALARAADEYVEAIRQMAGRPEAWEEME